MSESQPIVVFLTAGSFDEAAKIADELVNQKLAACVQILPEMQSVYVWQGEVQRDREVLVIAKTIQSNFAALETRVRALHSYETPEIIALPIVAGSQSYLDWLADSCAAS